MNGSDTEIPGHQTLTVNPTVDAALLTAEAPSPSKSLLRRGDFWGIVATFVVFAAGLILKSATASQAVGVLVAVALVSMLVEIVLSMRRTKNLELQRQVLIDHRKRLGAQLAETQARLTETQAKLVEAQAKCQELSVKLIQSRTASLLIEGLPVPSLSMEIESRHARKINQVRVDELAVRCSLKGIGPVRDAEVTYRIKGNNLMSASLSELEIVINGDNLVPLNALNAVYYDLGSDNTKAKPMKPVPRGPDGIRKAVALEFINPGVGPYDDFAIEFHYTWPSVFNSPKNYWFIHTLDFQETHSIQFEVDVGTVKNARVQAYSIGADPLDIKNVGRLHPESSDVPRYLFSRKPPLKDVFYVLVVDGE